MVETIEKNIEWINYLDLMYLENAAQRNNPLFFYYPNIKLEIESEGIFIKFRKQEKKTRILFCDNYGRTVYLSDVDIIKIIISSPNSVYDVICDILTLYIIDPVSEKINFKINDEDFYYLSLLKPNYSFDKLRLLRTHSFETIGDLSIKYIDLVTLLSLIINKEFLVDYIREDERVLRQAKKFLILCKFYKERKYLGELEQQGFQTSKEIEQVYNNKYAKSIDSIFDKISL